jgi:hypothetical protein
MKRRGKPKNLAIPEKPHDKLGWLRGMIVSQYPQPPDCYRQPWGLAAERCWLQLSVASTKFLGDLPTLQT